MALWKDHSRILLIALLVPIAFGCQQPFKLSDPQLSEHLSKNTIDNPGKIVFANGKTFDGYSLSIRGDSLEYFEQPNESGRHRAVEVHDVQSITINAKHDRWPLYFGIGGFTAGGCGGLMASFINYGADGGFDNKGSSATFNVTTPLIAAAVGAGLGVAGAYLFDPGFQQNAWIFKMETPRPEKQTSQISDTTHSR